MGVAVYYVVLGVDQRASDDDIHQAYQRLALNYWSSSDRNTTLAARRFRAAKEAYSVLGDPIRRAAYDAQLSGRMYRPSRSAGTASPAITAPSAARAPAPIAIPPSIGAATPVATGSVFTRLRPSVLSAVLMALLIIGMAGGPQRTTMSRIVGMMGRHLVMPDRAQPRGAASAGDPLIAAEIDPGPTLRNMVRLRPSRAVLLTTQAMPASRRTTPRGVSPDTAIGPLPWKPARQLAARAEARPPKHGNILVHHAVLRHGLVQPRAAWLAPGDDAAPDRPATRHLPRHNQLRMASRGTRRVEHGGRTGAPWRHGMQPGNERRRPRFADGRGRGTFPSRSYF